MMNSFKVIPQHDLLPYGNKPTELKIFEEHSFYESTKRNRRQMRRWTRSEDELLRKLVTELEVQTAAAAAAAGTASASSIPVSTCLSSSPEADGGSKKQGHVSENPWGAPSRVISAHSPNDETQPRGGDKKQEAKERALSRWKEIAIRMGGGRTADQYCERWHRFLRTDIRRDEWTDDEDRRLAMVMQAYGSKGWKTVVAHMNGRTERQCQFRWHQIHKKPHNVTFHNLFVAAPVKGGAANAENLATATAIATATGMEADLVSVTATEAMSVAATESASIAATEAVSANHTAHPVQSLGSQPRSHSIKPVSDHRMSINWLLN